jgi:hypothetical protein
MISNLEDAQNKFHRVLEIFINGTLYTRGARLTYPFRSKININPIKEDVKLACDYLNISYSGPHNIETIEGLAKILSHIYNNLLYAIKSATKKNGTYENIYVDKKFSHNDYSRDRETQQISKLVRYLSHRRFPSFIKSFFIHGSFSTMDYVNGISDLDTLIIIKDETLLDSNKLLELHHTCYQSLFYFYQIDPLQHHGYFVLTEADLLFYPQNYFPILLFNYSTSVFGSDDVKIKLRDNTKEREEIFLQTVNYLKENRPSDYTNIYQYKLYFQVLQLLPIAYLQKYNINIYKKNSFEKFYEYFPESKELYNTCLILRNNWNIKSIDSIFGELILKYVKNPNLLIFINRIFFRKKPEYMKLIFNDETHERDILPLIERMGKED